MTFVQDTSGNGSFTRTSTNHKERSLCPPSLIFRRHTGTLLGNQRPGYPTCLVGEELQCKLLLQWVRTENTGCFWAVIVKMKAFA